MREVYKIRRAKIVATLGPSSNTVEKIAELIKAGLNVARINMSHGTHEAHAKTIANVREASKLVSREVAILLDLQGPKIRADKLPRPLNLKNGEEWFIAPSKIVASYPQYQDKIIPTIYEKLVDDSHVGARILFDDGKIVAEAIAKEGPLLKIKILVGGDLTSNKGINLPNVKVSAPSFTDKDREDLMFGLTQNVDYVALSFVRRKEDVLQVKHLLHKLKMNIPIVSKIEKPEAIENIEEIINVSEVIMIARGDMGVEIGNHLVPSVQKKIITLCNSVGRPVITATQMLESMITNSTPTRAEASDVANAIWDGTDAVMLSGETASGQYPVEAITMMSEIVIEAERNPKERPLLRNMDLGSVSSATQVAASLIAEKISAPWIISVTESGNSCLKMTRFRPKARVLGVTNSLKAMRRMCLLWGISPYLFTTSPDEDLALLEFQMLEKLKKESLVFNGDKIVITHGDGRYFRRESSNSVRVEIIKNAPKFAGSDKNDEALQEVKFDKGRILLDTNVCASCQSCIQICPHGIWVSSSDEDHHTRINERAASACALDMECVSACPTGAIEIIPTFK